MPVCPLQKDSELVLCLMWCPVGSVAVPGRRDTGASCSRAIDIRCVLCIYFVSRVLMSVLENHVLLEGCHLQLPKEQLMSVPVPSCSGAREPVPPG